MAQIVKISGMGCMGCVASVEKALKALDPAVKVTLEPPQAQFSDGVKADLVAVARALAGAGSYKIAG